MYYYSGQALCKRGELSALEIMVDGDSLEGPSPIPSQDYFSAAEQQERSSQESERMELDSPGENQQGGVK